MRDFIEVRRSASSGVEHVTLLRSIVMILILGFLVFGPMTAFGSERPTADGGRSEADLAMERFLRLAEVVKVEDVGEGITCPKRLTLRLDGVEHRAIFKTVNLHIRDVVRTSRLETCFRDCFHYEAAAYLLDRLLGIHLVPVTIVREVNGVEGSVQEWIEDVSSLRKALDAQNRDYNCDVALLCRRLTAMYVLDSLIFNIDRNYDNILVNAMKESFFLIDHSRAFRTDKKVTPPVAGQGVVKIDKGLAADLKALNPEVLTQSLSEHLSKSQIKAVAKRRDNLLKVLKKGGLLEEQG